MVATNLGGFKVKLNGFVEELLAGNSYMKHPCSDVPLQILWEIIQFGY